MAPTYITSSVVLAEAMDCFKNNLRFGNAVRRVDAEYKGNMPKIGESFQIEAPWRFEVQDGPVINPVDLTETSVTVAVTAHKTVPLSVLTRDKTMKIHDFRKKYLEDAMIKLCNQVDSDIAGLYKDVGNFVGTAGTTPTAYSTIGSAAALLDDMSCPQNNRQLVMNPDATYSMADLIKTVHNPEMAKKYIEQGWVGNLIGMGGLYSSQNVKRHTAGTNDGNYLVNNAADETGEDITIDTGSGTILEGDLFTLGTAAATSHSCRSVNPVNYQDTGKYQGLSIKEDGTTTAIAIKPITMGETGMIASGARQNVNQGAVNDAPMNNVASHVANLAFHKDAFCLATIPFELPETAPLKEQINKDGIVMTLTGGFDVTNYREIYRLDIIYAVKTLRPEWAVRVLG